MRKIEEERKMQEEGCCEKMQEDLRKMLKWQ